MYKAPLSKTLSSIRTFLHTVRQISVLGILCGLTINATAGTASQKIIGGEPVTGAKYPWTVALLNANNNRQFCGGSIIEDRWILTAAHCVDNSAPSGVNVFVGGNRLNNLSEGEVIPVEGIYIHPEYSPARSINDVALLKLSRVVTQGTAISLASRTFDQSLADNTSLVVAGWGLTSTGVNAAGSNALLEATVPLRNRAQCAQNYFNTDNTVITDEMICAGGETVQTDSCNGDSGGPLFLSDSENEYQLLGIVSFGSSQGCASSSLPGVYARVSRFLDWIDEVQQSLLPLQPSFNYGFVGANTNNVQSIPLVNNGGGNKIVQGVSILSNRYVVSSDQCSGQTIAAGESCVIEVTQNSSFEGESLSSLQISIAGADDIDIELRSNTLAAAQALATPLEAENLSWFSGGDRPWVLRTLSSAEGGSMAQSGSITHNEYSVIMTEVTGPGTVSFSWQTSTEAGYDYLDFLVNGELTDFISGEQALHRVTYTLAEGTNKLAWMYFRDGNDFDSSANRHFARLDNVQFRSSTSTPNTPSENSSGSNGGGGGLSPVGLCLILSLIALGRAIRFPRHSFKG